MKAKLLFLNSMHKALEVVTKEVEITEVAFLISIINRFINQPVHHSVTKGIQIRKIYLVKNTTP